MSRVPKVLLVAPGLRIGGAERSLLGLLSELSVEKCDITLFLYRHDGDLSHMLPKQIKLLPEKQEYKDLDEPIAQVIIRNPFLAAARLLAKLVTRIKLSLGIRGELLPRAVRYSTPFLPNIPGVYDVAIGFLAPHDPILKKVRASKRIGWVHTDHTQEPFDKRFESATWSQLETVVAVSSSVAQSFKKIFPKAKKVVVIENIISPIYVRSQANQLIGSIEMLTGQESCKICTVARFSYAKGIDIGIKAARELLRLGFNFKWYLIGFGPDESELRQQVSAYGLEKFVTFLGKRSNPYPYIKACDVYVQPSRYEGKSVAVREAQILGRPVVISRYATADSQLIDGVDGVIADNQTPEAIALAIMRINSDKSLQEVIQNELGRRDYANKEALEAFYELIK